MTDLIAGLNAEPERLDADTAKADSALHRLSINGHPFYVLKQRGTFQNIAYDHGRLLAQEIEEASFPEIVATIARGQAATDASTKIAAAVYRAFSNRVLRSISQEFQGAIAALGEGYRDGIRAIEAGREPRFSQDDVGDAIVAIEVGNLVEGLGRRLELPLVRILAGIGALAIAWDYLDDPETRRYLKLAQRDEEAKSAVGKALRRRAASNVRCDFSCTGFSIPAGFTRTNRHIHARTLDADLYNWNRAPVLFLIDETGTNRNWCKYVAFGTAGLIYPGGISGLNEAGIAAALHQLSTTQYDSNPPAGDIAPFVQQRILREARTLDDAVDIAESIDHFAAWVIHCSDAKTGDAMRIEISGSRLKVMRAPAEPLAQTNHFLSPDFVEKAFDEDDAHFTPTFGKWLETRARFNSVKQALEWGRGGRHFDVDWAIDRLAASDDWYLNKLVKDQPRVVERKATERAFGRVVRKVYTQLGSIVVAHPDRGQRKGEDHAWMTVGDRRPGSHSSYVGWRIDWDDCTLTPVNDRCVRRTDVYAVNNSNWEQSLDRYVAARIAISRPRDAAGQLLLGKLSEDQNRETLRQSIAHLNDAITLAAADRVVEIPYHYMRARVHHRCGNYEDAKLDWDLLRGIWRAQTRDESPPVNDAWPQAQYREPPILLPYEAALVLVLSTATEDLLNGNMEWSDRDSRLAESRELFKSVAETFFKRAPRPHFDLQRWLELVDEVAQNGGAAAELPEETFVTVE